MKKAIKHPLKHQWSLGHNYMAGITFGHWLRLLAENKFQISPAYLHRVAFITLASLSNSGFAAYENLRYKRKIEQTKLSQDPLFVLGHWRSGTTLLHDLLAQDVEQFSFANTYQVVNPLTFLTTEKTTTKLLAGLLPSTRPMDNMALKFSSPQEDEFAPLLMSLLSVYMGISFPKNTEHYEKYLSFKQASASERERWSKAFLFFCKKLSLSDNSKSLLLKSPPHTARIKMILDIFPKARFVHIHRDPHRVFKSQQHFFDTACWYTYLQRPDLNVIDEGILTRYNSMFDAFFEDVKLIPKGQFHEIRFEDLERNPITEMEKTYSSLNLNNFGRFKPKLQSYVESLSGYQKNAFKPTNDAVRELVAYRWARNFEKWGYEK